MGEAYTAFASVYDVFMDETPYQEWAEWICQLLEEYGAVRLSGETGHQGETEEKNIVVDLGCGTGSLTELLAEAGYRDMVLAEWEGYLLVFVGTKAYLADSRATFSHENHMEYEWFYWDMGQTVTCAKVQEGNLYLGTDDDTVCRNVVEKAMVIGYTRMLRRAIRRPNDADSPAKIARCKEMLAILLGKVDSLVF